VNTYRTENETRLRWALGALRPADELEVRRQAAHLAKQLPELGRLPMKLGEEPPNEEQRYQAAFWGACELLLQILVVPSSAIES
jgi:hypothetical protein